MNLFELVLTQKYELRYCKVKSLFEKTSHSKEYLFKRGAGYILNFILTLSFWRIKRNLLLRVYRLCKRFSLNFWSPIDLKTWLNWFARIVASFTFYKALWHFKWPENNQNMIKNVELWFPFRTDLPCWIFQF